MPTATLDQDTKHLYGELEDRLLARDQVGGSQVYYQLLQRGRPLPEIMAEAVRIHAPYTHVPYHQRIDDGFPNFVNNDHCLLSARAAVNLQAMLPEKLAALPLAQTIWYIPSGLDIWNQKDPEGAGSLCDPRLQNAEYDPAGSGRLLAGSGAAKGNRSACRAPQQLADTGRARRGYRSLPRLSRADGRNPASHGRAGPAGVCRADRCARPDALQSLIHHRSQGLSRPLGGRARQCDRLGQRP